MFIRVRSQTRAATAATSLRRVEASPSRGLADGGAASREIRSAILA